MSDTGIEIDIEKPNQEKNTPWPKYTLLPKQITKPMAKNGLGYLTMADTHKPGARYEGFHSEQTGNIVYDENIQREKEKIKRNSTNKVGGTLAGIEHDIPYLRAKGIRTLFLTPVAGGDNIFNHRYQIKNNFQIADEVGNIDNFETFAISMFRHGMTYVFDAAFTCEGIEGINAQYALKWSHEQPDALYRHRLHNIKDEPIGIGSIPKDDKNTRYKLVNSPYILAKSENGRVEVIENNDYNKRKPTYFQLYDVNMVTDEQVNSKDLITGYAAPVATKADKLAVNTYQDIVIPYKKQIFDLDSFKITLQNAADYINSEDGAREINTPQVAKLVSKTAESEFTQKDKNQSLWEDKTGMLLRNHGYTGNDEKIIMSTVADTEREDLRKRIVKGAHQCTDEDIQVTRYWAGMYKNFLVSYLAKTLSGNETAADIKNLIQKGILPEEVELSDIKIKNIQNENYQLSPKGELERDEATVRALMELPLPALELAENTVSVLSQGFFFNRASNKDLEGMTRYELDLIGNPQLTDAERNIYEKTNKIFRHDIKNFADAIINKMDSQLKERIIDEDDKYTEFGEYLIEQIGYRITKYAFLKSLVNDDFIGKYVKTMPDGSVKYDYEAIRDITTLEDLGIPSNSMQSNAKALQQKIQKGMNKLSNEDVDFLVNAFVKQYKNSTTMSFRLSEAMYDSSSLGMDIRIDALKNVMDVDAVSDLSMTFDKLWKDIETYYPKIMKALAEKNPGAKALGEITDIYATMQKSWGNKVDFKDYNALIDANAKYPKENLAMRSFWIKSGITSEANYSDLFMDILTTYAQHYENGTLQPSHESFNEVIRKFRQLLKTRSVDNLRNLFTFNGNHDKPRVVHFAALDLSLYHNDFGLHGNLEENRPAREKAMNILMGVDDYSQLPLEIKLNIDNTDYFRTVSSQAIAMCNSLKIGVDSAVSKGLISQEIKPYFLKALSDLADGKYLDFGTKPTRKTINIDELQDIKKVITEIINTAQQNYGLKIDENTRNAWINKVAEFANKENLSNFSIHANEQSLISGRIDWIFESNTKHEKRRTDDAYSAYTATLLALVKKAFITNCSSDDTHQKAFTDAAIDFLNKYDKNYVDEHSSEFPYEETHTNAERKNGFANSEFEETILMLIEHAEYLAAKDGHETFKNTEDILKEIYTAIHEPAMNKSIGMATMLAIFSGIATEFGGDAQGQSGGEWKNNNVYNKNRNVIQRLSFEMLQEYRKKMQDAYDKARSVRNVEGAEAMNIGTPYMLDTFRENIAAWLMQSKDSMTLNIITSKDIDNSFGKNNLDFTEEIKQIELPYGIDLPVDTKFESINTDTVVKAIVKYAHDKRKNIIEFITDNNAALKLNNKTTRNRTLVLKRVPTFKGRNLNQQYSVTSPIYNTYNTDAMVSEGQKLSIMSK